MDLAMVGNGVLGDLAGGEEKRPLTGKALSEMLVILSPARRLRLYNVASRYPYDDHVVLGAQ